MTRSPLDARFVSRPNRFLVRASRRGKAFEAFLPNPGRLEELLRPRVRLRLLPKESGDRATSYDVLAVRSEDDWVCLDTRLANGAVADALRRGPLPEFCAFRGVRPEARSRDARFDFLLEDPGRCWLEVKTCSLVVAGRALFPDAPTERGVRHLRELARLALQRDRAAVLFVVVRRARFFSPNEAADPAFAAELRRADRAGVEVLARRAFLRGHRLAIGPRLPTEL